MHKKRKVKKKFSFGDKLKIKQIISWVKKKVGNNSDLNVKY